MTEHVAAALPAAPPPTGWPLSDLETAATALLVLALAGFFALLRGALQRSVPSRVLAPVEPGPGRDRLERLLSHADALAVSASVLERACDVLFVGLAIALASPQESVTPLAIVVALLASVPLLLLAGELLPALFTGPRGDALLRVFLPTFHRLQLPYSALVLVLLAVRRGVRRIFRLPDQTAAARPIVEGLRGVIERSDIRGELEEHEREIIANVIEFHDADVAEVMTPRTEIHAIDLDAGVEAAVRQVADSGHSRIPVYRGNLDTIVGVVSARDVIQCLANGTYGDVELRALLRPATFVPETKHVSELLAEFRKGKQKIGIVLDEYGGTAGLVTMGDLLAEIVGELHDEWDEDAPAPVRHVDHERAEVEATHRISEVNEDLGLALPEEEDYETLGGFVLAEFGHFPKEGERFVHNDVEFSVLEANDRRVLRVGVRRLAAGKSA